MRALYRKRAPKPSAAQLAEIERLEAEAKRADEKAEESFQRCDTDGFLSQWALNIGAQRDRKQIEVLRKGGYWRFPVLCDAEGNVLCDRIYRFANQFAGYGSVEKWRLPDDVAARLGRQWIPVAGWRGNSRIQKQLGLREEDRYFPARAKIMGSGTGLSGCASAFVGVERIELQSEEVG